VVAQQKVRSVVQQKGARQRQRPKRVPAKRNCLNKARRLSQATCTIQGWHLLSA
jgi:hypothetical protein